MTELWEQMKLTLYFMRLEDKYWGLFLGGLFVLFLLRARETGRLLVTACVTALVCICPITAYVLLRVLPSGTEYYRLWAITPALVVICAALTLLYERIGKKRRDKFLFVSGVFVILFLAGEFAYTSGDARTDDPTRIGRDKAGAYELMLSDMRQQGKETAFLWGPYRVMADSRIYDTSLRPIYGKDIEKENGAYDQTLMSLYQGYENFAAEDAPTDNKEEQVMAIANALNVFPEITCDYVVMIDPKTQGTDVDPIWIFEALGYVYVGESGMYQVYRRV
ncbi:MAG: hypothetical protein J6P60_00685 [Lachnospiraceae bacterium]|nr:hypothetical protein [Lachnospiraceae bacterium]